jgi:multidrug efflux pump subunit AcrB
MTTIPIALLSAVIWLWASGQTINIMTLGGLALAVGVLVDEATVEIENIHTHMAGGLSRARAIVDACRKTALPRLLSMLCVLAVFVPSYFMVGVGRQLFIPLSLAVGFAMISSYGLSSTLVPVLSARMMRQGEREESEGGLRGLYTSMMRGLMPLRWAVFGVYLVGAGVLLYALAPRLATEIFPTVDAGQFQLRMRAPTGTRVERTEILELKALDVISHEVGPENLQISSAFIGVRPASYPVNTIYLFTNGPQEAVMLVALKPSAPLRSEALKERLRQKLSEATGMRVLVRSRRHRQPGDEFRIADADRGGDAGSEHGG